MKRTRLWWVMAGLALAVAGYGVTLALVGERIYPPVLRESFRARPFGIFLHAFGSAIGLAIGPFQLDRRLLVRRRRWHRNLGKVYVATAMIGGGVSGFYMAMHSHGGAVTHVGFAALAVLTFATTAMAFREILRRNVLAHREWMIRSYALLFAAVTLRLELPLLIALHAGAFTPAYQIVSWLCWVPNLLWAEWHIRRTREPRYVAGVRLTLGETLLPSSGETGGA